MPDLAQEQARIEAAKQDPARFGDLYEENFYKVYAFIVRRVRERAVAEDLTSEVFRDALAGLPKFEWQGVPYSAWLLRIAQRHVADYFAKFKRAETAIEAEPTQSSVERTAELFQLVDRLPEAQFRVIHMRFVEQKSIREIAEHLGRSEGAVKQLQFRAVETLRAMWEGNHG